MQLDLQTLAFTLIKIAALLAWVYGLLWVMGFTSKWSRAANIIVRLAGIVVAFGIIQCPRIWNWRDRDRRPDFQRL
jgi:hypothetical protein